MISLLKHLRYYHIKEQNIFLFKGTVFKVAGWEDEYIVINACSDWVIYARADRAFDSVKVPTNRKWAILEIVK